MTCAALLHANYEPLVTGDGGQGAAFGADGLWYVAGPGGMRSYTFPAFTPVDVINPTVGADFVDWPAVDDTYGYWARTLGSGASRVERFLLGAPYTSTTLFSTSVGDSVIGMVLNPVDGLLYALVNRGSVTVELLTIDRVTGTTVSLVANIDATVPGTGVSSTLQVTPDGAVWGLRLTSGAVGGGLVEAWRWHGSLTVSAALFGPFTLITLSDSTARALGHDGTTEYSLDAGLAATVSACDDFTSGLDGFVAANNPDWSAVAYTRFSADLTLVELWGFVAAAAGTSGWTVGIV